jgi:hypothetical protein
MSAKAQVTTFLAVFYRVLLLCKAGSNPSLNALLFCSFELVHIAIGQHAASLHSVSGNNNAKCCYLHVVYNDV